MIEDPDLGEKSDDEDEKLDFSKISVLKSNLVKFSPCKAQCRRILNVEENLFLNGLDKLEESIDITSFLH